MLNPTEKAPGFLLTPVPSRWLFGYIVSLHAGLLISLPYYSPVIGGRLLLAAAVVIHGCYSIRRHNSRRHRRWIAELELSDCGLWVVDGNGRTPVRLVSATCWSWLIAMRFKSTCDNRHFSLLVLPDSCRRDQQRRLRVFLRHCLAKC